MPRSSMVADVWEGLPGLCAWQGKMRNRVIKKAKTNGDELGFLW